MEEGNKSNLKVLSEVSGGIKFIEAQGWRSVKNITVIYGNVLGKEGQRSPILRISIILLKSENTVIRREQLWLPLIKNMI